MSEYPVFKEGLLRRHCLGLYLICCDAMRTLKHLHFEVLSTLEVKPVLESPRISSEITDVSSRVTCFHRF